MMARIWNALVLLSSSKGANSECWIHNGGARESACDALKLNKI